MHYTTSGRCFLATEDGEDSVAGPSQCTYLVESSAEASAKRSRRLATLTKNKTRSTIEAKGARREQENVQQYKARTGDFSQARYLGSLFMLSTVVLYCSLDSY